ncbi:MAG: GNAT family N-acetyltransferase [Cyanobacteria bacterium REEB67]|nr:GNAT family N-acetyltransferase [Cyanobacteria bacterium REEB67]
MKTEWTEDDLEIEKLSAAPSDDFECPRQEQTEYFVKHAWADHQQQSISVTYVLRFKGQLVGYVTLTMDEIPLAKLERPEGVAFSRLPAVKLAQMGVHKDFNGNGFGPELVTFAVLTALELREKIGCRYVTLDANGDLVEWYKKQGFVLNDKDNEASSSLKPRSL